ncbi:hypothetical protein LTR29_006225 [Friedmanniomyces endolithicus]|nr:hypothetical protein LTR29_006225 [Friedmanniomyces endolithicus]
MDDMQRFTQTALGGPVTPDQLLSFSNPPQAFRHINTPVASFSENTLYTQRPVPDTTGFTRPPASGTMGPVTLTGHQRPSQVLNLPTISQTERFNGGQYSADTTKLAQFGGPAQRHAMLAARQPTSQYMNMPVMRQEQNFNYEHHNTNIAGLTQFAGPATPNHFATVANHQPSQRIAMPSTPSALHVGHKQHDKNPVFYSLQEVESHFKTPQMWPTLSGAPFFGTAKELAQKYPQMAPALDQVYRDLHGTSMRSATARTNSHMQQPQTMFTHCAQGPASSAAFVQAQDTRQYMGTEGTYALPIKFATNVTGPNILPISKSNFSLSSQPTATLRQTQQSHMPMKTIRCHAGTENAHLVNVTADWAKTRCPRCYEAEIALVSQYESTPAGKEHMHRYIVASRSQEMRKGPLSRGQHVDLIVDDGEAEMQGESNMPARVLQGVGSHESYASYRAALVSKASHSRVDLNTTSAALREMNPTTPQRRRASPLQSGPGTLQTTEQVTENFIFLCAHCGLQSSVDFTPSQNNGVHCKDCCDTFKARGHCIWDRAAYDITVNGSLLDQEVQALVIQLAKSCRRGTASGAFPCACTYPPKLVANSSHLPTTQMPHTRHRQPPSNGSMPSMSNGTTPSPFALSESITPNTAGYMGPSIVGPLATRPSHSLKRKRGSSPIAIANEDDITQSPAKRTNMTDASPLAALDRLKRISASSPIVIDDDDDVEAPPVRRPSNTQDSRRAAHHVTAGYSQPSPALLAVLAGENAKIAPPSTAYGKPSPALLAVLVVENNKNAPLRTAASRRGPALRGAVAVGTDKIVSPSVVPTQPAPASPAAPAVENKSVVPQFKKLPPSRQTKAALPKSTSRPASVVHAPPQETICITPEGFLVGPTMTSGPQAGYHQVLATNMSQPPPYSATPPIVRGTPPGPDAPIATLLEAYLPYVLTHAREMQPVQLWAHGTCPTWQDFGEHARHRDEHGKMRCRACDKTGMTSPGVLTKIHNHFASQV